MRLNSLLICAVSAYLFAANQAAAAQPRNQCVPPSGMSEAISKKYPGASIVTLADLEQYNRKLFQKGHGTRCPGLVKVNFYGDGKPTWALVLKAGEGSKQKAELVVARQLADDWDLRSLDTSDTAPMPVVWRQGPGKYEGMSEPTTIRAAYQVIVFCGYESWAILYAWTGKEVVKTWISD